MIRKKMKRQLQQHIKEMIDRQLNRYSEKSFSEATTYARTLGFLSALFELALLDLLEYNESKTFELANWDLYHLLRF
jgi:hypothetical protein